MQRHDPYAAFRVRGYRLYVVGWLVSVMGAQIQGVAVGWEVYQRTGKALALGLVGLAQALPMIALALPAGYLADTFDRRKVVMWSLLGTIASSLGLAALSFAKGPVYMMYGLLVIEATVSALTRPARMSLVPQIVPREMFPSAVVWNSSLMQVGSMIGPAIGGFVILLNVPVAYLLNAVCALTFVVLLGRVDLHEVSRQTERATVETLLAGLRFLRRTRLLLSLMALDMFAVLLGGATYLLPIYAQDILHVGPQGFGWLRAAPAVGAFFMAVLMAHLPPMRRAGRNLLLAVAGFGAATIVFGLSTSFWLSLAMLFMTGVFDNVSMVIRGTLIQLLTPDAMRGRVSAVNGVFIGASNQLGGLESGLAAHWFGAVFSVVSGGIGTIAVVLITALSSKRLRAVDSLHETRLEEKDAVAAGGGS
ncbi:MAG: MFS transporter [Candidatus Latescibacteria bacterium]|nr:MFS transporter [Candidatus Latescibacterota bacterium]